MDTVKDFLEDEMCVHEGGIEGLISFGYDDATFNWHVSVGSEFRKNVKRSYGRSPLEVISNFKREHRQVSSQK